MTTRPRSDRTTRKQTLGVVLLALLFLVQPLALGGVACGLDGDCCCTAGPAELQPSPDADPGLPCCASEGMELPGSPLLVAQHDRCGCSAVPGSSDEPEPLAGPGTAGSEREALAERLRSFEGATAELAPWEGVAVPEGVAAAPPDEAPSAGHSGAPWALLHGGVQRLLALLSVALS